MDGEPSTATTMFQSHAGSIEAHHIEPPSLPGGIRFNPTLVRLRR